jgi:putative glutamine amidotransferase
MKQLKIWHIAVIFVILCDACSKTSRDDNQKELKIAIAWRADTENEFCTNVVEAFRLAGVNVTVLPQVKASYIDYEGSSVSANQLDADGIGYLSNDAGLLVRAKAYDGSNVAEVLRDVDGVVFTGGEDISPSLYAVQEDWHHVEAEIDYNAARDVSDYLTMAYCLDHDIPILGFCRGSQMLGVVSGATMIQDLPVWFASHNLNYNYEHRREKSEGETYRDYTPHDVKLAGDSHLAKMFGTTTLTAVPSWHHQAILSVDGTPLSVTATTSVSGIETIEGIERKDKRCAVAVQFHPEAAIVKHLGKGVNNANASQFMSYETAMPLFRSFIECCK